MEFSSAEIKNIKQLYGIIKGINADEVINKEEVNYLKEWIKNNQNSSLSNTYKEIYEIIEKIIEDNIVTEEEKNALIKICDDIKEKYNKGRGIFYTLLEIIEGIKCDEKINEEEIKGLNNWLDENRYLSGQLVFDKINDLVKEVLEDNVLTSEEAVELKELFDMIIITPREEMNINYLRAKVRKGLNIGNNIISIYANQQLTEKIHLNAKAELLKALNKSTAINLLNTEIIFISLCLIALKHYDGNFYDYVEEEYEEKYEKYSRQRIDGTIRMIIKSHVRGEENSVRLINYVLENVLVPQKFLSNYFDFVYDIYKVNFQFMINPEELDEELEFVFNGLKDTFNDDTNEVNIAVTNKTYKLIKSTKDLIYTNDAITNLITFTKDIIKIIDSYYWNNTSCDDKSIYFKEGFEQWIKKNNKEVAENKKNSIAQRDTLSSRWQPMFKLVNNEIYLSIPEHKIKNDYDYNDIKILVYEDNKLIKQIEDLKIFEIIGGYRLTVNDIKIENPLNKIKYQIRVNEEIIYDSKEILYKEFILFNENGNNILPNRNYEGNLYITYQNNIDESVTEYYRSKNYVLGNVYVNNSSILKIENEFVTFSSEITSGIVGNLYKDTYILNENKRIKVYKDINQLIFETELSEEDIGLKINDKRNKLIEYKYICKNTAGKNTYFIDYNVNVSGKYTIEFFDVKSGKQLKNGKYELFIDNNLTYTVTELDKDNYNIEVHSDLELSQNEYNLNLKEYDKFNILIKDNNITYRYSLPLNIPIYKIDDGAWHSLEDYIWIEDVKISSVIYFQGIRADELVISKVNGEQLNRLKIFKKEDLLKVDIGMLRSYINTEDFVYLSLFENEIYRDNIECYLKCAINEKETLLSFNPETNDFNIQINIFGEGEFKIQILNTAGKVLYNKEFTTNETEINIKNLKSLKKYIIKIFKTSSVFSLEEDTELYSKEVMYYAYKDIENKRIKVKTIDFDFFDRMAKRLIRKTLVLHGTYFEFLEYMGDKKFRANVYKWENEPRYLRQLNPIEVELISDIEDGAFEVSANKDGDGLLIDFNNKTILDNLEDAKAIDIYSYQLKMKEME